MSQSDLMVDALHFPEKSVDIRALLLIAKLYQEHKRLKAPNCPSLHVSRTLTAQHFRNEGFRSWILFALRWSSLPILNFIQLLQPYQRNLA